MKGRPVPFMASVSVLLINQVTSVVMLETVLIQCSFQGS